MYKVIAMLMVVSMAAASVSFAGETPQTQVSKVLELKGSLSLTPSQVKKLEVVERTAEQKMMEAKAQSDIRLNEIEKFTSDWSNMNSVAVMTLIKEYFKFMTDYKTAEYEALLRARAILDSMQLSKFQQLVSIESLMLKMEGDLALR
jgi:hypothetical protein